MKTSVTTDDITDQLMDCTDTDSSESSIESVDRNINYSRFLY